MQCFTCVSSLNITTIIFIFVIQTYLTRIKNYSSFKSTQVNERLFSLILWMCLFTVAFKNYEPRKWLCSTIVYLHLNIYLEILNFCNGWCKSVPVINGLRPTECFWSKACVHSNVPLQPKPWYNLANKCVLINDICRLNVHLQTLNLDYDLATLCSNQCFGSIWMFICKT